MTSVRDGLGWAFTRKRRFAALLVTVLSLGACKERQGINTIDGGGAIDGSTAGAGGLPSTGSGGVPGTGGSGAPLDGGGNGGTTASDSGGMTASGSGGTTATGSGGTTASGSGGAGSGGMTVGTGGSVSTDGGVAAALLTLTSTTSSHDFGGIEVGVASSATTFMFKNTGGMPTGTLTPVNDDPNELTATGCTGTLAAGATCALSVTFKPTSAGLRTGTMSITATPGGSQRITVSATGSYRVTVTKTGTGTVTSVPAGLTCGTTCTGLFATAPLLTEQPGANQRFAGWTGPGCAPGVKNSCLVNLASGPATLTASFVPLAENLAFITSATFASNLGAPSNYDARCNAAATAVGINDSSGSSFVAVMSSASSAFSARLGSARGWVRLDGRPLFDTLTSAQTGQVFNGIQIDETGTPLTGSAFVMTGLDYDYTPAADLNCGNWSGTGTAVAGAFSDGGPYAWANNGFGNCGNGNRIICLGKTRTAMVKPTVAPGKKIWVSPAFVVGGGTTPDALCQANRPSGVTSAVALISTTTRAASAVLSSTQTYVRPDGTVIGTGAEIAAGTAQSGIWQPADGTYPNMVSVWTGSPRPDATGTAASTCGNWSDASMTTLTMRTGIVYAVSKFWWNSSTPNACTLGGTPVYCVQTAP